VNKSVFQILKKYTQEIINGELILRPKKQYMTENELNMTQITHSTIKKCIIKKEEEHNELMS
jgi:hypothetical protein